jgi:hypothetical protein
MPTNGKLKNKWEQAIAALITAPSDRAAAEMIGVTPQALCTWKKIPAFAEALAKARSEAADRAIEKYHLTQFAVVDVLVKDLEHPEPDVRHRAAELLQGPSVKLACEAMRLKQRTPEQTVNQQVVFADRAALERDSLLAQRNILAHLVGQGHPEAVKQLEELEASGPLTEDQFESRVRACLKQMSVEQLSELEAKMLAEEANDNGTDSPNGSLD